MFKGIKRMPLIKQLKATQSIRLHACVHAQILGLKRSKLLQKKIPENKETMKTVTCHGSQMNAENRQIFQ